MNQLKKVTTGIGPTCLASNDSGSDANTQSVVVTRAVGNAGPAVGQKRLWAIPATPVERRVSTVKATPTAIPDVLIIEPKVFGDARGARRGL